jgi:hypothetical protein
MRAFPENAGHTTAVHRSSQNPDSDTNAQRSSQASLQQGAKLRVRPACWAGAIAASWAREEALRRDESRYFVLLTVGSSLMGME